MTQTQLFITRLESLKEGERSRLRRLAGQPLDEAIEGFDLFTGLWWPLRSASQRAPRRESSWLVAKLFATSSIPHLNSASDAKSGLPTILGQCEPREDRAGPRFRSRFDALLCSPHAMIEPHLHWSLKEVSKAVAGGVPHARGIKGIDWAVLLDDLSLWDRSYNPKDTWQMGRLKTHKQLVRCHESHRTPQDVWACEYLHSTNH